MSDRGCAGAIVHNRTKKCWTDPKTGHNSFMLFARDLSINGANDNRYWTWGPFQDTSNLTVEVAELENLCRLEVRGNCDASYLSPRVRYEVKFLVMLKDSSNGWTASVTSEFIVPDGTKQIRKHNLLACNKNEWGELQIGEFETCQDMNRILEFSLLETDENNSKSGLVIKGVIFQPKRFINVKYDSLIARDLSVIWGDETKYWRWICLKGISGTYVEVAELLKVCWLQVSGTFNTSKFLPEIIYEVLFQVKLKDTAQGWEEPVNLLLEIPGEEDQEQIICLSEHPREEWIELKIGEFKKCPEPAAAAAAAEIKFSLFETRSNQWKSGLVLRKVIIRPKED